MVLVASCKEAIMLNKEQYQFEFTNKNWGTCIKDPELTWGAKGLYAYLVKFPEHFCLLDILRLSKDTQSATQAYLKELEEAGYLISDNKIK